MKMAAATRKIKNLLEYELSLTNAYICLLLIVGIFFLPILIANTDYIDDNARAVSGYYDWGSLGRFMTELLMRIVTFSGATMADPGRLMQVLSIPVLATAGLIFSRALNAGASSSVNIATLLASLPVILNPFLLANFAFRYDSLSMILAYALAIAAACVLGKTKLRILSSAGMVFVVAGLYQPMVMVFAMAAVVLWAYRSVVGAADAMRRLLLSVGAFIVGTGAYFVVLKIFNFSNVGGESRGLLLPLNRDGVLQAARNFYKGLETISLLVSNSGGKLIGALLIAALVVGICLITVSVQKKSRQTTLVALILSLPLLTVSIMGPFVLMNSALTYQVRTLAASIGVIALVAVLGLALMQRGRVKASGMILAVVLLCGAYVVSLSYNFGGALAAQREHDMAVYDQIDDFILRDEKIQSAQLVYVGGLASRPDSVNDMLLKRPFIGRMEVANDNSTWYIWQRLSDANVTPAGITWYTQSAEQEAFRAQLCSDSNSRVYDHPYFSVYQSEGTYVIWQHDPQNRNDFCQSIT